MVHSGLILDSRQLHSLKSFLDVLQLRYDLPSIYAVDFRTQVVIFTCIPFKIILLTLTKFNHLKILEL